MTAFHFCRLFSPRHVTATRLAIHVFHGINELLDFMRKHAERDFGVARVEYCFDIDWSCATMATI